MSDLVKRLRDRYDYSAMDFVEDDLVEEAADEIEKLREEIEQWHKAHAMYEQALAHLDLHDD